MLTGNKLAFGALWVQRGGCDSAQEEELGGWVEAGVGSVGHGLEQTLRTMVMNGELVLVRFVVFVTHLLFHGGPGSSRNLIVQNSKVIHAQYCEEIFI